jgi:outer membrane biosynthesis protein TonB
MLSVGLVALLASAPLDAQALQAPRVVSGVIPAYPSVAAQARISGRFRVRVKVNVTGTPVCADLVDPQMPLMKPVTEEAALAWRFEPASLEEMKAEPYRQVELTFVFVLVDPEAPTAELLPRFKPPYEVEVRERKPR